MLEAFCKNSGWNPGMNLTIIIMSLYLHLPNGGHIVVKVYVSCSVNVLYNLMVI